MKEEINGFYAGAFDPFTIGHLEIIKKCAKVFDKVFIGIGCNSEKKRKTNENKMKIAIEETLNQIDINNVQVIMYSGVTSDIAKEYNCNVLIRGLRNSIDYQYEEDIANVNEKCFGLDTCYFRAGELGYISSSMVMELYKYNKEIETLVPEAVYKLLMEEK